MGYGGPKEGETHEVTIELEGKVEPEAFAEYLEQLRNCMRALVELKDKKGNPLKLKVRQVRTRIRRKK